MNPTKNSAERIPGPHPLLKARSTLSLAFALSLLAILPLPQANALGIPNPIGSFTLLEDSPSSEFDLNTVFSDASDFSVIANSNPDLVVVSISGGTLILDYLENQSGSALIRVTATDGVSTVANSFTVTVAPVNDFPFTTPGVLPDTTTTVNTPVSISFTVNDVEDDALPTPLAVSPSANINPIITSSGLISIQGGVNNSECMLTMTPLPGAVGEATISVTVRDSGFPPHVTIRSFKLTVTPSTTPNDPPVAFINVSPDADLDGGDPEIILISVNGVDAPVMLDGTGSFDPDPGDVLASFAWFADSGSGPVPVGEAATLTTRLGIGEHLVFLSVSDGSLASPFTIQHVRVITIGNAIGQLIASMDASSLPRPWKRLLRNYLLEVSALFTSPPSPRVPRPCAAGIVGLRFFDWLVGALSSGSSPVMGSELSAELNHLTDQILSNVSCP